MRICPSIFLTRFSTVIFLSVSDVQISATSEFMKLDSAGTGYCGRFQGLSQFNEMTHRGRYRQEPRPSRPTCQVGRTALPTPIHHRNVAMLGASRSALTPVHPKWRVPTRYSAVYT